jgi:hypothetical protein
MDLASFEQLKGGAMNHSVARVESERASIYLQQLCKHFAHKRPVEFTPEQGQISLGAGMCRLDAANGVLTIRAEADDPERLVQLQDVIAKHLERFAFRSPVTLDWRAAAASEAAE